MSVLKNHYGVDDATFKLNGKVKRDNSVSTGILRILIW